MSGLLFISGGLFTAITIGLFQLIGFNIEDFYFENVVVWGLPSIPLIASYLIFNNKDLVSKISPIIAKIFTPFVFLILSIFYKAADLVFNAEHFCNANGGAILKLA